MAKTSKHDIKTYVVRRAEALLLQRSSYEPIMKDLRDYILPEIGQSLSNDPTSQQDAQGQRHDGKIINSMPTNAALTLAAGMQAGITSPSAPWFRITVPYDWMYEVSEIRDWLDYVQDVLMRIFAMSNMYKVFHQCYMHMAVWGTACAIVVEDDESIVHGYMLDQGSYAIGLNKRGQVDTIFREFSMTYSQLADEFGKDSLPQSIQEKLISVSKGHRDDDGFCNVSCLIEPNSDAIDVPEIMGAPFRSIYWLPKNAADNDNEGIIAIRHYSGNPILCPRWMESPGVGNYGYGPGRISLGDCMQLQEMEKDKLKAIRKVVDPPLAVPDTLKGQLINTYPGSLTYFSSAGLTAGKSSVTPLYEVRPDLGALENAISTVENRIRNMFYYDLFKMFTDMGYKNPPTAQEIIEKKQEKLINLGPVVESMTNDLDRVINRVFQVAWEKKLVPPPPLKMLQVARGNSLNLRVKYISPLATAQRMIGLQALQQYSQYVAQMATIKPDAVDKLNVDGALDHAAVSLGVPANVVPGVKEVAAIRGERAKQQEAVKQQEAAIAASQAAKNLGQAKMTPDTGLGALRQSIMGAAA